MKNFLFYSCKKATELIEKGKIVSLNPLEKSRLVIHVSMCDACRSYQESSDFLDRQLAEHFHHDIENQEDLEVKKETVLKKLNIK